MKHRNGFVSNSSSSSFIILGTSDPSMIRLIVGKFKPDLVDSDDEVMIENIEEFICEGNEESIVSNIYLYDFNDVIYLGVNPEVELLDKTINQVREEIVKAIDIHGIEPEHFGLLADSFYDG